MSRKGFAFTRLQGLFSDRHHIDVADEEHRPQLLLAVTSAGGLVSRCQPALALQFGSKA
jgi:hypothetical protein